MNYLEYKFEPINSENAEKLMALLVNIGFESFVEEENILKAFVKEGGFDEVDLNETLNLIPVEYKLSVIAAQNWNAQWESSFEPVIVNDFAAVRAGFHQPITTVKHELIITPKMSFGTGHHATTFMMIEQMAGMDFKDKKVMDFGTGTAVLAILAEKLGASSVYAIDNDDWSIENSIENAAINQCTSIQLEKAEEVAGENEYDIILANINLNVILSSLKALHMACKKSGFILLSGFLKSDEKTMFENLQTMGFNQQLTLQKGEWICILAQNKG